MPFKKPYVLSVLSGPNAGASLAMGSGRSIIGNGEDATVMLDTDCEHPIRISLQNNALSIKTDSTSVSFYDGEPIPANTFIKRTLPATVCVDETTVVSFNKVQHKSNFRRNLEFAGSMTALVAAFLLSWFGGDLIQALSPQNTTMASPIDSSPNVGEYALKATAVLEVPQIMAQPDTMLPEDPTVNTGCNADCIHWASVELQDQFKQNDMNGLSIEPATDVIRISGYLPDNKLGTWDVIRKDLETQWGMSLPLIINLSEEPSGPNVVIASVWLGASPEVRTKRGEVLYIGDSTDDGWSLNEVLPGYVVFVKNGLTTNVSY